MKRAALGDWAAGREREEWAAGERAGWAGKLGLGWVDFGCGFAFYFSLFKTKSNKG